MTDDPRKLPPPPHEKFLERIEAFALDLAYGVKVDDWPPTILVGRNKGGQEFWNAIGHLNYGSNLQNYLNSKWGEQRQHPAASFLQVFEYMSQYDSETTNDADFRKFILTPKAISLLERPISPPLVFVSYKRSESSTFALLVEARLRLVGVPNPFVDKSIIPGQIWEKVLQERIQQAKYFVCLIGPETLSSPNVQNEIIWAAKAGCTIISIWHNGMSIEDSRIKQFENAPFFRALKAPQVIPVDGQSAIQYEEAVNKMLNAMGYPTY
jgi:hypothetical protein